MTRPLDEQPLEPAGTLSPIIRSLRYTGDEVQLGRILAAICQDPAVASPFVRAVIGAAQGGEQKARRRVEAVPDDVTCMDERILRARVGRTALRRRFKDAGRVDLDFAATGGWRMLVELKLGSRFGKQQLERYSEQSPVAAVVRDPGRVPDLTGNANWVGAAGWSALSPALRTLPLEGRAADEWHALLDVLEDDGDLSVISRPPAEVVEADALLSSVTEALVSHVGQQIVHVHGEAAQPFASRLRARKAAAGRGPWVGFGIGTQADGDWIWIALRNLWSRAPRLRIWYWEYSDSRAKHRNRAAHEHIERQHGFVRWDNVSWLYEEPVPALATRDADDLRHEVSQRLSALVDAGIFAVAVARSS